MKRSKHERFQFLNVPNSKRLRFEMNVMKCQPSQKSIQGSRVITLFTNQNFDSTTQPSLLNSFLIDDKLFPL